MCVSPRKFEFTRRLALSLFDSTTTHSNVNIYLIPFVGTASLASAIFTAPPCSSATMTDVHDTSDDHTQADVRTEPPVLRSEDELNSRGISFEESHDDGFNTQHREVTGTDLLRRGAAHAAIGASHERIPQCFNIAVENAFTTSQEELWSSCITHTMNDRDSRHDALQDARSDPCFQLNLPGQDFNVDARTTKQALGARHAFHPGGECRTTRAFPTSRFTWLSGNIVFICSLSTVLSAAFALLAMKGQRYGDHVGTIPKRK
jgi:hypothetical protein